MKPTPEEETQHTPTCREALKALLGVPEVRKAAVNWCPGFLIDARHALAEPDPLPALVAALQVCMARLIEEKIWEAGRAGLGMTYPEIVERFGEPAYITQARAALKAAGSPSK